jgi:hypothetical protein
MGGMRSEYKNFVGIPEEMRPLGRHRQEDNIKVT